MANVCTNYITIQGRPELINVIAKDYIGYNEETDFIAFSFNLLAPIPDDLDNDYYWRIENWGNKWDGSDAYIVLDCDQILISVDTACGPCDKWTFKLIELCPALNIEHEYQESGEGFIGWIRHYENEGPNDYEDVFYNVSYNPFEYWYWTFEKEYESFDWLYERIEEVFEDEEITEEQRDHLIRIIDEDCPLETIIQDCIEFDIL